MLKFYRAHWQLSNDKSEKTFSDVSKCYRAVYFNVKRKLNRKFNHILFSYTYKFHSAPRVNFSTKIVSITVHQTVLAITSFICYTINDLLLKLIHLKRTRIYMIHVEKYSGINLIQIM